MNQSYFVSEGFYSPPDTILNDGHLSNLRQEFREASPYGTTQMGIQYWLRSGYREGGRGEEEDGEEQAWPLMTRPYHVFWLVDADDRLIPGPTTPD